MTERYATVNGQWPEGTNEGRDLKPTPQEALSAARRLYRFAMGRPFKGKMRLTSGRRYTSIRGGVFTVNPDRGGNGWHSIVHLVSHHCAARLYPKAKPHSGQHAFLEREMIRHVVESGWLDGKLRRPEKLAAPKPPVQAIRQQRVLARIKTWEAKRARAERALRKLRRQARYYDRVAAA